MKEENEMIISIIYFYPNIFLFLKNPKNNVVFLSMFSFKFLLFHLDSCFIVYFMSSKIKLV